MDYWITSPDLQIWRQQHSVWYALIFRSDVWLSQKCVSVTEQGRFWNWNPLLCPPEPGESVQQTPCCRWYVKHHAVAVAVAVARYYVQRRFEIVLLGRVRYDDRSIATLFFQRMNKQKERKRKGKGRRSEGGWDRYSQWRASKNGLSDRIIHRIIR